MAVHFVEREIGGRTLRIETGKIAKQASGAVMVTCGDTVVLGAALVGPPRPGIDFFPLTVDYREKTYAAGKFPGGFFKREARPTNKEILTMRGIDRPIRPLFPTGYRDEVLIQTMTLSADPETDPDICAMISATAALCLSSIPFDGPIGNCRVGYVDGEYVLNPTYDQLDCSTIDMVLAGHKEQVNMIEVGAREASEDVVAGAVEFGHRAIVQICEMISELTAKAGKEKSWDPPPSTDALFATLRAKYTDRLREARRVAGKQDRYAAVNEVFKAAKEEYTPKDGETPEHEWNTVRDLLDQIEGELMSEMVVKEGRRSDGRSFADIRQIDCEVAVLPRVHGSSLFQRGETQALCVVTLGTGRDEQVVDGLMEEYSKKFMLHYNFPPLCVGEIRRLGATSRREIGHGDLAERSLISVLPAPDKFPYTVRLVSEIMESNGSSSMASVCGGCLALMDAGVPIRQPVAGISIGSFSWDGERKLVVDILGEEDHHGEMDFKVSGTQFGITGVQLDLKRRGIEMETIREVLAMAKDARMSILKRMLQTLSKPRSDTSPFAPRMLTMKIDPEKIGKVIGPGGKGIRALEADSGAKIEINDDGTINIACLNVEGAQRAMDAIEAITAELKVGKIYSGRVVGIKDFGAFVEVAPGQDGLCHISELDTEYVRSAADVVKIGDQVRVKVLLVDDQGRIKLSRKAAMEEEASDQPETVSSGR
jgi:polyribonucleotide nucleotidyltransferase